MFISSFAAAGFDEISAFASALIRYTSASLIMCQFCLLVYSVVASESMYFAVHICHSVPKLFPVAIFVGIYPVVPGFTLKILVLVSY